MWFYVAVMDASGEMSHCWLWNNHLALEIKQSPTQHFEGTRRITCPTCCNWFKHDPVTVNGDPRNFAYVGKYWLMAVFLMNIVN